MKPVLYAHPFSSYCQKVLTALYENGTAFEYRLLDHNDRRLTVAHGILPVTMTLPIS